MAEWKIMAASAAAAALVVVAVATLRSHVVDEGTSTRAVQPTRAAVPVAPAQRIVPNVVGRCFRTPMGDVVTVTSQEGGDVSVRSRQGSSSVYLLDQLAPSPCGNAPAPLN